MKLFTGWIVSAGLVLTAAAANAQVPAPSRSTAVSDVGAPYSAMPPEVRGPVPAYGPGPVYGQAPGYGPGYGYGPALIPPLEVYEVVRESGFSPLGIPRQRGLVYTIAVVDRRGDSGRLVIDARDGRIIRFMPAYRMDDYSEGRPPAYGPPGYGPMNALPPVSEVAGVPRPPAPSRLASRTPVPVPKASPQRPVEAKPVEPAQQSASVQIKPSDAQPEMPRQASPPVVEAKPAAQAIQPTQTMPKMQGLD